MTAVLARPVRGDSSIRQVVVALTFVAPPGAAAIRDALALHDRLVERYPRRQELKGATLTLNAGAKTPGVTQDDLVGFRFDYVEPDGSLRQAINLADKVLYIQYTDCSDFVELRREIEEEFRLVLTPLAGTAANVGMERFDRFVWTGPRSDFRAASILRPDGGWLAPNIFDATDMWHSNHGLFEFLDSPRTHRLLHAVDVHSAPAQDAVPSEREATVVVDVKQKLQVLHEVHAPGQEPQPMSCEDLLGTVEEGGLLREYMSAMLTRSDSMLSNIVNDDMKR